MLQKLLSVFLSITLTVGSTAPVAAMGADEGTYFFRYKNGIPSYATPPEGTEKDITAFYVGGIGLDFAERLPMKPEWEDDSWSVSSGVLPDGITFNSRTLTFEGKPTSIITKRVVELKGHDATGKEVASASATFDIYDLPDQVVKVNFYGHTGKFGSNTLKLPAGVTVHGDPDLISPTPPGITYNAAYFEGTPTKPGQYPVLAIGSDYLGKPTVAFIGNYIVEDGPTFPKIANDIRTIKRYQGGVARWFGDPVPRVNYAIAGDTSKVRYYIETKNDASLPKSLYYTSNVYLRQLYGAVGNYYDEVEVRYRAVDTDGTIGTSNWFKLGSGSGYEMCEPYGGPFIAVSGIAKTKFNDYRIPSGSDGAVKKYELVSGSLPEGLTLDEETGVISGTPVKEEIQNDVKIDITFPGNNSSSAVRCGPFQFHISPADFSLEASRYAPQLRIGTNLDITLTPTGGLIAPYSVSLDQGGNLPSTVSFNSTTGKLTGPLTQPGHYFQTFRLRNGDGVERTRTVAFSVHNALKLEEIADIRIPQYDYSDELSKIVWDADTIIGDASVEVIGGPLPNGFHFDGYNIISGGTRLPPLPGGFGPFTIRLTDGSGEHVDSNPFRIIVEDRSPLETSETTDLEFSVNLYDPGQPAMEVTQPKLAENFLPVEYSLSGPNPLPEGLMLDTATGKIKGIATRKGTYTGFILTATELSADGLTAKSDTFTITVKDPPPIADVVAQKAEGNVDGPSLTSALPLPLLIQIRNQLVGYETGVVFDRMEPAVSGLTLNTVTGQIQGRPLELFDGEVTVFYKDAGGREGKIIVPVEIYPYPQLGSASTFEVPRLSDATTRNVIVKTLNEGFYKGVNWSVDPSGDPLPLGMKLLAKGNDVQVILSTKEPVNSERHVKIAGTSIGNGLRVLHDLTIKTVAPLPLELEIPSNGMTRIYLNGPTGNVMARDTFKPEEWLNGSYVTPLNWALGNNPSWMSIDKTTGQIIGNPPQIGTWPVKLSVRDAEGTVASSTGAPEFKVRATLNGAIGIQPGGEALTVRVGETIATRPQSVSNAVSPFRFEADDLPSTMAIDPETGVISGRYETDGNKVHYLSVVDDHDRTATHIDKPFRITVVKPLQLNGVMVNPSAKLLTPEFPIRTAFRPATNVIGKASYSIVGEVPGTLFYREPQPDGLYVYKHYPATGGVETISQGQNQTIEQVEAALPADRLIFDTYYLTLIGVPSKPGTFPIEFVAYDNHMDTGYTANPNDATREANNVASQELMLTVEDRAPLLLAAPFSPTTGTQYDITKPVVVSFPGVQNNIGPVEYTLTGDLPGTLYYKTISQGLAQYRQSPTGPVVTSQGIDETPKQAEARLANDRFIFDTTFMQIVGIGSRAGKVQLTLHAEDKHGIAGLAGSPRNKAEVSFEIEVLPAPAFTMATTIDGQPAASETLHQFTSQAKIISTVTNAAYGLPVTWTKVSGSLPGNVTGATGATQLTYSGYPDTTGTYSGIVWKATDAAGREANTPTTTLTVGSRLPLEIASSKANPRTMVVYSTEADILLSGKNTARGQAILPGDWAISGVGNLPPGLTHYITPEGVRITGTSNAIGSFTGFRATGRDAQGAQASIDLRFDVIANPAPIELNVFNVKTKVGYPVRMEPPFSTAALSTSNTYGKLRFYSYDLPTLEGIQVNGGTGFIDGEFETVQKLQFDLYVTDETDRLTSKPVQIDVIPNLRLIAPAQSSLPQGEAVNAPITTDYVIGTVSYQKGAGVWPDGVSVNPQTGALTGTVSAAVGSYPGLTIIGTDTFGTYKDIQTSNVFAINITAIDADPVISDITSNKLVYGTVGVAANPFTPTVRDSKFNRPWNYAGTIYKLNHDLTPYGLTFNSATGQISGTPTKEVVFTDMTITVTSQRGDSDTTAPFWFGVAPAQAMTAVSGQRFSVRKGQTLQTAAPKYDNFVGKLTYYYIQGNSSIGVNSVTGSLYSGQPTSSWTAGDYPMTIRAIDEFGRSADASVVLTAYEALTLQVTDFTMGIGASSRPLFVLTNLIGVADYDITGLPSFLTFSPSTKTVSGTVPPEVSGNSYPITVKVTDGADGTTLTKSFNIRTTATKACIAPKVDNRYASTGGSKIWFVSFWSNVEGAFSYSGQQNADIADIRFYDSNGDCYTPIKVKSFMHQSSDMDAAAGGDGDALTVLKDGLGSGIWFDFGVNVAFSYAEVTMVGNTNKDLRSVFVCRSTGEGWGYELHQQCSPTTTTFAPRYQMFSPGAKYTAPAIYNNWVPYTQIDYSNANQ